MHAYQLSFIDFALARGALRFGSFTLKSGRQSPYFFNTGVFDSGSALRRLGEYYASALVESGLSFDMLYGPAYKGITLASALAVELARQGRNVPFAFNRKEAKSHGEGGTIVGRAIAGRVLIIDDVISAGTSVRESIEMIKAAGATPCGVVIALDRMERGSGELSAVQEVGRLYSMPAISIANLDDLVDFLRTDKVYAAHLEPVNRYREQYGVASHA